MIPARLKSASPGQPWPAPPRASQPRRAWRAPVTDGHAFRAPGRATGQAAGQAGHADGLYTGTHGATPMGCGTGNLGGGEPAGTAARVADLGLPPWAAGFLERAHPELNAMQAGCVRAGLLDGRSVLVLAPTAGGKTLVAFMAILSCIHRDAGRAFYLCPTRSLAHEKYGELEGLRGLRPGGRALGVAMSIGGHDEGDEPGGADVVVTTNERLDSMMRRGPRALGRVGLIVADEVHMVGDRGRGPALETVIAHAKSMGRPPQLVGLSATAPNADELARWLGATAVQTCTRPVTLHEGVYDGESLAIRGRGGLRVESGGGYHPAVHVGLASALGGDKTLVFADTKPHAVAWAKQAAGVIGDRLPGKDRVALNGLAARIAGAGEPTAAVGALASCVRQGVAFHHAGLAQRHKGAVEAGFREGGIRLVVATPTLAVGVNLPARRVVVSRLDRYDHGENRAVPISVREYKQMAGRAGRPGHGTWGESVIVTDAQGAARAWDHYIDGKPERVVSGMADAALLRAHLLGLVVARPGIAEVQIAEFFLMTLAAIQNGEAAIRQSVRGCLEFLCSGGFVYRRRSAVQDAFTASRLGTLTARMYMDPSVVLRLLEVARARTEDPSHTLGLMHAALTHSSVFKIRVRKKDEEARRELVAEHTDGLFTAVGGTESGVDRPVLALWLWIEGASTADIADRLDIEEGTLGTITRAVWPIVRCIGQLSLLEGNAGLAEEASALAARIEHGVRPELLDLVGLRHVGRAHARTLYARGHKSRESLRSLTPKRLAEIIPVGEGRAAEIIAQASAG